MLRTFHELLIPVSFTDSLVRSPFIPFLCRIKGCTKRGANLSTYCAKPLQAEAQLVDHLLAHQKLLDLAGNGHRKAVDESDIARDLVMRDLTLAESADLFHRRAFAVAQAYPCAELFAVACIGYPNHLDVLDLRMQPSPGLFLGNWRSLVLAA